MKKKNLLVMLPVLFALTLTGCNPPSTAIESAPTVTSPASTPPIETSAPVTTTAVPSSSSPKASPVENVQVLDALNNLTVVAESGSDTYDRDAFNHWTSKNTTGCDTRYAVLVEESISKAVTSGCTVVSGEWLSVYDGQKVTDPKKLDIDHMVPLKEAWESGASQWDATKREAFANDLSYADSLVAVTAGSNRSKSDRDPAGYLPTDASNRCSYVSKWVAVKTRWNLTLDAQEKAAISSQLKNCGSDVSMPNAGEATASGIMGGNPTNADTTPAEVIAPAPAAPVAPVAPVAGADDPKFTSCKAALAAGYGPYTKADPEYGWYRDGDGDGIVCEK